MTNILVVKILHKDRRLKNNYASLRIFADPAYASLQRSAKCVKITLQTDILKFAGNSVIIEL